MKTALDLGSGFGFASYALATIAFTLLSAHFFVSWRRSGPGIWLLLACLATVIAYGASAVYYAFGAGLNALSVLHFIRNGAWLAFLLSLLVGHWRTNGQAALVKWAPILFATLFTAILIVEIYHAIWVYESQSLPERTFTLARGLVFAFAGLVMVENVYFSTHPSSRWSIKFLCIAVGSLFAYDLFIYVDTLLFGRYDASFYQTRGIVNALVAPLLAVSAARNPAWSLDVFFSRRIAFHAFSVAGVAAYLFVVALSGHFIGARGGEWAQVVQTLFVFCATVLLLLILFSGRFRSRLVIFLNKHFFNYKYDYREEWLRFIHTVSRSEIHEDLRVRVIKAAADIVDSPSGALFLRRPDERLGLAARWNFPAEIAQEEPLASPLSIFLAERNWVVNLDEFKAHPARYGSGVVPDWVSGLKDAWLILPLIEHDQLLGFILLTTPRAPRQLNWEDFDILKTVCGQSTSYLAEQELQIALAEARRFEDFNRRFAFVMHDIKNLLSQLSLLVANAEKHGANPEFRDDMVLTVRVSVEKLNRLLNRLHGEGERQYPPEPLPLAPLINRVIEEKRGENVHLTIDCQCPGICVAGHRDRLGWVFRHLIQNAIDARPRDGVIALRLYAEDGLAVVEIKDHGAGMSADFVANELFRPFRSTKEHGFGLGAYEAREVVRELGGRLDVESALGEGTTVYVRLPVASAAGQGTRERRL